MVTDVLLFVGEAEMKVREAYIDPAASMKTGRNIWRHTDDEPDGEDHVTVDDHFIHAWHQYAKTKNPEPPFHSKEDTAGFLRSALTYVPNSLTGLGKPREVGDAELLSAAKDAWERRHALVQRYKAPKRYGKVDLAGFLKRTKVREDCVRSVNLIGQVLEAVNPNVARSVANDRNTPPEVLLKLSSYPHEIVR